MDCREMERVSVLYHSDELSPQDREAFERHVQVCSACARRSHETERAMSFSRQALVRGPSADVSRRVAAVIGPRAVVYRRWSWALVPAAAVLIVGLIMTPRVYRDRLISLSAAEQDLELFQNYEMVENIDMLESLAMPDAEVAAS